MSTTDLRQRLNDLFDYIRQGKIGGRKAHQLDSEPTG